MSKVQMLRCFVNQRLTAAAQEICGLFERTIAEYEEELCSSQEENERHRKRLQAVFNPEVRLHRADVQQLLVVQVEGPPEQQAWSSSLDQEDPEPPHMIEDQEDPEPPHIKEEQEDPEPPHIKEDQEDPEPPHIKEDQEDPEPPHIKEDQEDPEPPHIKEDQED
ncbi:protein TsetseEP-like [Pseudoliparis swirei]|uniref:protein TsetseEP-like n=1 Tax=Pseudoliparis swirei TaxID=2059687 RepID=UPI0024BEFE09|nr:protein TsetseEP-like [Pseudoliparis swirei]